MEIHRCDMCGKEVEKRVLFSGYENLQLRLVELCFVCYDRYRTATARLLKGGLQHEPQD